jgi:hypothetical protein
MLTPGQPYITGETARSYDDVPVSYDWHDFLMNVRTPGADVILNFAIRPPRAKATGFQWLCTTAGLTSGLALLDWPTGMGEVIEDGSVVWTSVAVDATSFRTTIATVTLDLDAPLTYSDRGVVDYIETILVSGLISGTSYLLRCDVVCANGDKKQAVLVLPVQD